MDQKQLQHMIVGGVIAIAIVVPVGVYAFVKSGVFDVGASSPHTKFTQWITHETMIHSVRRHAVSIEAPRQVAASDVVAAFCAYETNCVDCHGAAAVARRSWVGGMEPSPPYLLDATSRFTPTQLFWIVRNGIKMTGMPSWRSSMSDAEIWSVVAWLEASSKLPPQTYVRWRVSGRCSR